MTLLTRNGKIIILNGKAIAVGDANPYNIMTSNEIRQVIGVKPSNDPSADELRNKNQNSEAVAAKQGLLTEIQNGKEEENAD